MSGTAATQVTILRRREVMRRTGLATSTIYWLMSKGSFPQAVRLGEKAVGWRSDDIENWLASRPPTRPTKLRREKLREPAGAPTP